MGTSTSSSSSDSASEKEIPFLRPHVLLKSKTKAPISSSIAKDATEEAAADITTDTKVDSEECLEMKSESESESEACSGRKAVLIGGTGATGKHLLFQLLRSEEWDTVTSVHRREVDVAAMLTELKDSGSFADTALSDAQLAKFQQHTVDDLLTGLQQDDAVDAFRGHHVCFSVLGTKRAKVKSAAEFREVDFEMTKAAAVAAQSAGVAHFSLLTSKGADANVWASEWKISHGLFYLKTKGEIENEVMKMKFPRTSIFRPGILERTDGFSGTMPKAAASMMGSTHVRALAKVMIVDAETEPVAEGSVEEAVIYEKQDIDDIATAEVQI